MAEYTSQIKIGNTTTSIGLAERANQLSYFTCSTEAATAAKTATRANGSTIKTANTYSAGSVVIVKFTNGNTATSPSLEVDSDNAVPIVGDSIAMLTNETLMLVREANAWRIVNKIESLKWETF